MSAVMVSRFVPQKDQELLVRAAAALDTVDLHFVGDGATMTNVKAVAAELGMADRCYFHGLQADVPRYLAASDVFCQISNWEGFPLTTIEAMRAGRPTLVSDVGGAGEAVVDGETGFIVSRGDVIGLRRRLSELAGSPERRIAMGRAARRRFEACFTFDRMYERTLDVYQRAVQRRAPRQR